MDAKDAIVPELRRKLKHWVFSALCAFTVHYACGIIGVAASGYAASPYPYARVAAILSTICFGILWFIQPIKFYHKFMSAARMLQDALYDFDAAGQIDLKSLLRINKNAEQFIQKMDEKFLVNADMPNKAPEPSSRNHLEH